MLFNNSTILVSYLFIKIFTCYLKCLFIHLFKCCLHLQCRMYSFPLPTQPEIIKKGLWKVHFIDRINTIFTEKMPLCFVDKMAIILLRLFYLFKDNSSHFALLNSLTFSPDG